METNQLNCLEQESIDYFVSFVQIFGLPKSIGQIYGLLFVAPSALPMDGIQDRLGISKGSLSQGLSLLRELGAVKSQSIDGDRREHYQADMKVARISNHFFENRLQPRLKNGQNRLSRMADLIDESIEGEDEAASVLMRVEALQKWHRRGVNLIPIIVNWLKR